MESGKSKKLTSSLSVHKFLSQHRLFRPGGMFAVGMHNLRASEVCEACEADVRLACLACFAHASHVCLACLACFAHGSHVCLACLACFAHASHVCLACLACLAGSHIAYTLRDFAIYSIYCSCLQDVNISFIVFSHFYAKN